MVRDDRVHQDRDLEFVGLDSPEPLLLFIRAVRPIRIRRQAAGNLIAVRRARMRTPARV